MINKTLLAATAALIVLSTPVLAADTDTTTIDTKIKADSNGNYSEKDSTTTTSPGGVKDSYQKKVDVDVDSKGNTDTSVTTAKTQKTGWFHKDSVKTKDTENDNANGTVTTTHKKTVNGTTTENDSTTTGQ